MSASDIRWQQRLDNYLRALLQLRAAVALAAERTLPELAALMTRIASLYVALFDSFAARMPELRCD